nr:MAG TPA: hypothetical protein [Caudoviricetes sp.]DAS31961.1 MAG TPA: hypothetical protein [Caudoviricetes sp.]
MRRKVFSSLWIYRESKVCLYLKPSRDEKI